MRVFVLWLAWTDCSSLVRTGPGNGVRAHKSSQRDFPQYGENRTPSKTSNSKHMSLNFRALSCGISKPARCAVCVSSTHVLEAGRQLAPMFFEPAGLPGKRRPLHLQQGLRYLPSTLRDSRKVTHVSRLVDEPHATSSAVSLVLMSSTCVDVDDELSADSS